MLYCQKHNFRPYKPHPHTEHFANMVCWYALGKPGLNSDLNRRLTQKAYSFLGGNVKL